MKKKVRKSLALLLTLALALSVLSVGVLATDKDAAESVPAVETDAGNGSDSFDDADEAVSGDEPEVLQACRVNPLYADVITPDDLRTDDFDADSSIAAYADSVTYTDVDAAATYVREQMVARKTVIHLTFDVNRSVADDDAAFAFLYNEILDLATEHTGNGCEGDYLLWHYGGCSIYCLVGSSDGYSRNIYSITYTMTYYSTAGQEAAVTERVNEVLNSFGWTYESDYERFCDIYEYICTTVTYDQRHLNDGSYTLKLTAYAALINKTAICQGYANLLYRMALDAGIDCRIISGTANGGDHAWNIVRLGDRYYNVDVTFDSNHYEQTGQRDWSYLLKSNADFNDNLDAGEYHVRDGEYNTAEFNAAYPMATTSYDPEADGNGKPTRYMLYPSGTADSDIRTDITQNGGAGALASAGSPSFAVADGTYQLAAVASGRKYVPYITRVTLTGGEVDTGDVTLCALGDVNGDGDVTARDATLAYACATGQSTLSEYAAACADTDGSGGITARDATNIYAHAQGAASLW